MRECNAHEMTQMRGKQLLGRKAVLLVTALATSLLVVGPAPA